ncbi:MAG TPA: hypothetical protein VFM46_00210 [Pseudomonadales bacterium]|nr:hypothetical protein [Pseudomonadales bacterium]
MKPFKVVDMQIARNPVARAIANKNLADSVRSFQTRLYLLDDGEHCESDATAAMQVFAVLIEAAAMSGKAEEPDFRVIRGAMSCLVQIAQRGFKWRSSDAGAIDTALDRAVAQYKTLPAVTINKAWARVMEMNRRIHLEVAA